MEENKVFTIDEAHLHFAKSLNGETWNLLDKAPRSRDEDERLVAAAFASYYHWLQAGKEVHRQRGEYMIARAYLAVGNVQEALAHADRCLELTDQYREQMADFDLAFAYEMSARTNAAAGQREAARQYREQAQQAGERIADQEDREIFFADYNGGNWYNL
jgi:tetratricopeptide (TPR) repeat protein